MFGSLPKLWRRQLIARGHPEREPKTVRAQPDPMMVRIMETHANEDKVLELIELAGHDIDRESGLVAVDDSGMFFHWSQLPAYQKLARGIRFKTTIGWPDPATTFIALSEAVVGDANIRMGIGAGGALRFLADTAFRHQLLDVEEELNDEESFVRLVLPAFPGVERVAAASAGMITGAMVLRYNGDFYWNPERVPVCRALFTDGFFDFQFLSEESNGS